MREISASAQAATLDLAWQFMSRGSAPFALLRRNLGEPAWQQLEHDIVELLPDKYGSGPQTLTMVANIGVGRKQNG